MLWGHGVGEGNLGVLSFGVEAPPQQWIQVLRGVFQRHRDGLFLRGSISQWSRKRGGRPQAEQGVPMGPGVLVWPEAAICCHPYHVGIALRSEEKEDRRYIH